MKYLSILLLPFLSVVAGPQLRDLNAVSGKVFNVDLEKKQFEILIPTAYDPKTNEGKSRYLVHWDSKTQFKKVESYNTFRPTTEKMVGDFHYLDQPNLKSIKAGQAFHIRNVNVFPANHKVSGLRKDGKRLVAMFQPNPKDKKGRSVLVHFEDKLIKASLSKKPKVNYISFIDEHKFKNGFFNGRIYGKYQADKFFVNQISLTQLVDPRTIDDPELPRVLVIGDSISMNYHEAAKKALKGKANYYRVEGNGGPSDRGVSNLDLWLGDHLKKGFHWDVIQFNHGLHDLKQPFNETKKAYGEHQVKLTDYKNNLKTIVEQLKKTNAKLIWCSTTPVPNNSYGKFGRRKDEDLIYNKAALEIIEQYSDININDLNQTVRSSKVFDQWREGNNVHFYNEEQTALGEAVAKAISKRLAD